MQRKAEGEAIRDMFNGDIRETKPCHHCVDGHCATRQVAIDKAVKALIDPLRRHMVPPALNKWNTVAPIVKTVLLVLSVHRLLARSELRIVGRDLATAHEPDTDADEGAPRDVLLDVMARDKADKRKKDRVRRRRMREFLAQPSTLRALLAWACAGASDVMHLHYYLFTGGHFYFY